MFALIQDLYYKKREKASLIFLSPLIYHLGNVALIRNSSITLVVHKG